MNRAVFLIGSYFESIIVAIWLRASDIVANVNYIYGLITILNMRLAASKRTMSLREFGWGSRHCEELRDATSSWPALRCSEIAAALRAPPRILMVGTCAALRYAARLAERWFFVGPSSQCKHAVDSGLVILSILCGLSIISGGLVFRIRWRLKYLRIIKCS